MKTVEIIGYKRANLGKKYAKKLRTESLVPCVLYGGAEQMHFSSPMILFRDVIYTPEASFVKLNIEGTIKKAILQEVQFHPVSEIILHADFLELNEKKPVVMNIPVKTIGSSPGVKTGGRLIMKVRHLKIKAIPSNMPESIELDISELNLGKSVKVSAIKQGDFSILTSDLVTICSVEVPRAMKGKDQEEEEEDK